MVVCVDGCAYYRCVLACYNRGLFIYLFIYFKLAYFNPDRLFLSFLLLLLLLFLYLKYPVFM